MDIHNYNALVPTFLTTTVVRCLSVPGIHGDRISTPSDCEVILHYDGKAPSYNPGLQYPHLHGPVHTPDNNRWDTPPV